MVIVNKLFRPWVLALCFDFLQFQLVIFSVFCFVFFCSVWSLNSIWDVLLFLVARLGRSFCLEFFSLFVRSRWFFMAFIGCCFVVFRLGQESPFPGILVPVCCCILLPYWDLFNGLFQSLLVLCTKYSTKKKLFAKT